MKEKIGFHLDLKTKSLSSLRPFEPIFIKMNTKSKFCELKIKPKRGIYYDGDKTS